MLGRHCSVQHGGPEGGGQIERRGEAPAAQGGEQRFFGAECSSEGIVSDEQAKDRVAAPEASYTLVTAGSFEQRRSGRNAEERSLVLGGGTRYPTGRAESRQ